MNLVDRIKPSELGSRLKAARITARVTQETAASALGVARTTIVAIENGDRQVRPAELEKLAELYGVSLNSLLRESAVHFDLVPQFRRSSTARNDQDVAQASARELQRLAAISVELEQLLGIPKRKIDLPEYRINKISWSEQAEDIAGELRKRLGIGVSPLVDIFVMAEAELGVRVFFRKLPSKIAGLFAFHSDVGACVLINSVHRRDRCRWTCAHEIAHLLTNRDAVDVAWLGGEERGLDERFADRFASALLMPASTVRLKFAETLEEHGRFSPKHLFVLSRWFNVSMEAMCRRLEQLTLLQAGTYDSLKDRGLSVSAVAEASGAIESDELALSLPRLATLAVRAWERDLLTEGQVCDLLDMDRIAVRKLFEALQSYEESGALNGQG